VCLCEREREHSVCVCGTMRIHVECVLERERDGREQERECVCERESTVGHRNPVRQQTN